MRAETEQWLLRHWYGAHRPPWYLRALEPVYRAAFRRAQRSNDNHAARLRRKLPLIVVGNITAGGSGKTPMVMHLCRLAADMGLKPGIASTGYGRLGSDTRLVVADCDTRDCGDEPVLLAKRTGVPVMVAKRRADAVAALEQMDLDLVISDDGLQHSGLGAGMEVCVVDGARGLGNGHLLPAGPLRESAQRLGQVDFVVTTGVWNEKPGNLETFVMQLVPGDVRSLDEVTSVSANQFRQQYNGKPIHAFAAIGHPRRFFVTLEELGITALPHVFPDHHVFEDRDFDSIPAGGAIIMTEKDAVKCRSMGLANAWYLPVDACLPDAFDGAFREKLAKLLETRK